MSETRPRRSRLTQIKEKLEDDTEAIREEFNNSTITKKREINLEESQYKAAEIKDPQSIEETTRITKKNMQMTEVMMRRLEALEHQQNNDIGPRFTTLEAKITENSKNIAELLEVLKNQPKLQEVDYQLDPEPQPEPEPEMEPLPELPPLPKLEDEPPLELEQESEPEIPPLPELKLPEEEKLEEQPKPEVPKLDSETQTDPVTLPEEEEREKRREERRQRRQNKQTAQDTIPETCEIKERDIQLEPNELEIQKENTKTITTENTNTNDATSKEVAEIKQAAEEKSVESPSAAAGGRGLSFELIALIILIVLELAHLLVISK